MKQSFLLAITALVLTSCDKTNIAPIADKEPVAKTTASPILGNWYYRDYTYRSFTIDSVVGQNAYITFGFTIDAPNNKSLHLKYDLQQKGDTLFCTTTTIYPCMYFTANQTVGWGIEYANIPAKGSYLPLSRVL